MGYTVYFKTISAFPAEKVNAFLAAVRAALTHPAMPPVAYEYDQVKKAPEIGPLEIRFNGLGDYGHETFFLDLTKAHRGFCKTNEKAYTKAAIAVLKLAEFYAPGWCKWDDDGHNTHHDDASAIVQSVLANPPSVVAISGPMAW